MRTLLIFTLLLTFGYSHAQDKAKIEKLLEFVKVKGGTFTMGSTEFDDAQLHKVKLSTFYIQKTEVTQSLWKAVMGSNPSEDKSNELNPVTNVSWNDCQEFIKKLNSITNKKYRLPTEAEWEFAARGGKLSKGYKYSGSDNLNEVAWYSITSENIYPVAQKKPNELGLYDMSGNVWEWCQDYYSEYHYDAKVRKDPKGPDNGDQRVFRGGSWRHNAMNCLVVYRRSWYPDGEDKYQGFRLLSPVE